MITIRINGPRGSGKSTALHIIARALAQYQPGVELAAYDEGFSERGKPILAVREPTGTLSSCKIIAGYADE